jgi:hypothetical protein
MLDRTLTMDDLEMCMDLLWALPLEAWLTDCSSSSSNERKSGVSGGVNSLLIEKTEGNQVIYTHKIYMFCKKYDLSQGCIK